MKKYVPELARYSRKYIYEPWTAPIADQKKWGCRITGDANEAELNETAKAEGPVASSSQRKMKTYPKPMFDFAERREICIESMKNAYKINLHGADPDVLNGTWKKLFGDSPGRDLLGEVEEEEEDEEGEEQEEQEEAENEGPLPREESPPSGSIQQGTDEDEREAAQTGEGDGDQNGDGDGDGDGGRGRKRRKVK